MAITEKGLSGPSECGGEKPDYPASDMIGLVMPERVNPFFVKVYDGVTRKADEENITVLFYKTDDG